MHRLVRYPLGESARIQVVPFRNRLAIDGERLKVSRLHPYRRPSLGLEPRGVDSCDGSRFTGESLGIAEPDRHDAAAVSAVPKGIPKARRAALSIGDIAK
jgi:hypothetical protein